MHRCGVREGGSTSESVVRVVKVRVWEWGVGGGVREWGWGYKHKYIARSHCS